MSATGTRIRRALDTDAAALAAFGRRVFAETFAADNRPEDIAMYLDATYGREHQARELQDPAVACYLAEREGRLAGYALLRAGQAPPCIASPHPLEVVRFYVDGTWHGTGLARMLMDRCVEDARQRAATALWLGVWERNARAIRFYGKAGFRDVGAHRFLLGTDVQTDRLMMREL